MRIEAPPGANSGEACSMHQTGRLGRGFRAGLLALVLLAVALSTVRPFD
jgi:hypothetical protein